MPETPIWLLSRGRYKDAENALCWLRGWVTPEVVKEEFMQLVEYNNNTNIIVKSKTTQVKICILFFLYNCCIQIGEEFFTSSCN
jgi:Sugar (and other) transporter.